MSWPLESLPSYAATFAAAGILLAAWVYALFFYTVIEAYAPAASSSDKKVAIVAMMRDPIDVDEWLNYHLSKGVSAFYIRLEVATTDPTTDPIARLLLTYPQVTLDVGHSEHSEQVTVESEGNSEGPGHAQMVRQRAHVTLSIERARKDGVDWLVHIDSDELLECKGRVADAIETDVADAGVDTQTLVIKNVEAVYDRSAIENTYAVAAKPNPITKGCFSYKDVHSCEAGKCVSYANGKSIGRVSPFLREAGVHRFRYDTTKTNATNATNNEIVMKSLRLVHFESCDFSQYVEKFMKLSRSEKLDFPFPYYNESIAVARSPACMSKSESCRSMFAEVYKKYRTL